MIKKYLCFAFLFTTTFSSKAQNIPQQSKTVNDVLQKTHERLTSIQTLHYVYYYEFDYKSEDYKASYKCSEFLDFQVNNTITGFAFQIEDEKSKQVYNGKDNFLLNKKNNTIKIYAKNVLNDFTSLSAFFNSIITLKNAIPLIINDAEIEKYINDTSVATKQYHVITLILKDKGIGSFGKFQSTSIKRNFFYKILIEKNTYLPFKIIQTNNAKPDDFAMTTFENIIYNAQNLPELSWYYSTYLNEYKQIQEKQIDVIKVKSKAPEFVLPFAANSTDSLKLSGFVGNVVLLEFWEKNCGYCISAVPKLNSLINKFKEVKFKIFGINVGDSRNDIELFYKRNQPLFKSVVADTKVVEQYGITGYPTIVVIDKKGAVLYAGNMDIEKIESVIESGLR